MEIVPQEEERSLKRVLGPFDLLLLGVGAIIGAGLFSLTGIAAAENAGPAITLSFLLAALGCAFSGLCYCELASLFPVAGSAYTYTSITMGRFFGWIMGWSLILEYAIGSATISISWSAYFVSFLQAIGIHVPDIISKGPLNFPALGIIVVVSAVLILGIKESSRANSVFVALKLFAVLIFIGLGYFYINPENYVPYIPENTGTFGHFGASGVLRGAALLFFAYIGFDALSTAAQETKNPQVNMPIGILGSLAICTLLYVLFGAVLTGVVNYKDLNVAAPLAVAFTKIPYPWLDWLVKLAVLAGLTSGILVMLLGQSRIFYAMAKDGLLPAWIAKIHPKFQTPWHANLVLMVFVGLFGAFAPLTLVGHMTSIGTLFAFTMVCFSVLILRYTHPELPRPFRVPFAPLTPLLGIIICLAMMFSFDIDTWIRFLLWVGCGIVFYFFFNRNKKFKTKIYPK